MFSQSFEKVREQLATNPTMELPAVEYETDLDSVPAVREYNNVRVMVGFHPDAKLKKVKLILSGGKKADCWVITIYNENKFYGTHVKANRVKVKFIVPEALKLPLNAIYEEVLDVVESCHPTVEPETIRVAVKNVKRRKNELADFNIEEEVVM